MLKSSFKKLSIGLLIMVACDINSASGDFDENASVFSTTTNGDVQPEKVCGILRGKANMKVGYPFALSLFSGPIAVHKPMDALVKEYEASEGNKDVILAAVMTLAVFGNGKGFNGLRDLDVKSAPASWIVARLGYFSDRVLPVGAYGLFDSVITNFDETKREYLTGEYGVFTSAISALKNESGMQEEAGSGTSFEEMVDNFKDGAEQFPKIYADIRKEVRVRGTVMPNLVSIFGTAINSAYRDKQDKLQRALRSSSTGSPSPSGPNLSGADKSSDSVRESEDSSKEEGFSKNPGYSSWAVPVVAVGLGLGITYFLLRDNKTLNDTQASFLRYFK